MAEVLAVGSRAASAAETTTKKIVEPPTGKNRERHPGCGKCFRQSYHGFAVIRAVCDRGAQKWVGRTMRVRSSPPRPCRILLSLSVSIWGRGHQVPVRAQRFSSLRALRQHAFDHGPVQGRAVDVVSVYTRETSRRLQHTTPSSRSRTGSTPSVAKPRMQRFGRRPVSWLILISRRMLGPYWFLDVQSFVSTGTFNMPTKYQ